MIDLNSGHWECICHIPTRTRMVSLPLDIIMGKKGEKQPLLEQRWETHWPPGKLTPSLFITQWFFLMLMGFPSLAYLCVLDEVLQIFYLMCQLHSIGGGSLRYCVEMDSEAWSHSKGKRPWSIQSPLFIKINAKYWLALNQDDLGSILVAEKVQKILKCKMEWWLTPWFGVILCS